MGPKIKAVCDSGPFIHLSEIGALRSLSAFNIVIPPAVKEETRALSKRIKVHNQFDNNIVQILQNEFGLDLAESQCIALAKTSKISLFLTDDLDARTAAKQLGLEPHGTVGILLKAYRQKIFSKKQTIEFVQKIKTKSTLYITTDIIQFILAEIEKHSD